MNIIPGFAELHLPPSSDISLSPSESLAGPAAAEAAAAAFTPREVPGYFVTLLAGLSAIHNCGEIRQGSQAACLSASPPSLISYYLEGSAAFLCLEGKCIFSDAMNTFEWELGSALDDAMAARKRRAEQELENSRRAVQEAEARRKQEEQELENSMRLAAQSGQYERTLKEQFALSGVELVRGPREECTSHNPPQGQMGCPIIHYCVESGKFTFFSKGKTFIGGSKVDFSRVPINPEFISKIKKAAFSVNTDRLQLWQESLPVLLQIALNRPEGSIFVLNDIPPQHLIKMFPDMEVYCAFRENYGGDGSRIIVYHKTNDNSPGYRQVASCDTVVIMTNEFGSHERHAQEHVVQPVLNWRRENNFQSASPRPAPAPAPTPAASASHLGAGAGGAAAPAFAGMRAARNAGALNFDDFTPQEREIIILARTIFDSGLSEYELDATQRNIVATATQIIRSNGTGPGAGAPSAAAVLVDRKEPQVPVPPRRDAASAVQFNFGWSSRRRRGDRGVFLTEMEEARDRHRARREQYEADHAAAAAGAAPTASGSRPDSRAAAAPAASASSGLGGFAEAGAAAGAGDLSYPDAAPISVLPGCISKDYEQLKSALGGLEYNSLIVLKDNRSIHYFMDSLNSGPMGTNFTDGVLVWPDNDGKAKFGIIVGKQLKRIFKYDENISVSHLLGRYVDKFLKV